MPSAVHDFVLWASVISIFVLISGFIFFIFKSKGKPSHNHVLELLWLLIPLAIFIGILSWGWVIFQERRSIPQKALNVGVVAKSWSWEVLYPSGRKVGGNDFIVPVGRAIALTLSSPDVVHGFYVPGLKIKQEIVPGTESHVWFQADRLGEFYFFCTVYCGEGHSSMTGKIKVVPVDEFQAWANEGAGQ